MTDPATQHVDRLLAWLSPLQLGEVVVDMRASSEANADWARSGAMALTGRRDGPALPAPGAPASALCGALALLQGLTGAPMPDIALLGERAAIAGLSRQGPCSVGGSYQPIATADGWAGLSLARDADIALVPALVKHEVVGDPWCAVRRWAADRTGAEVADRAQLLGLAGVRIAATPASPLPMRFRSGGNRRSRATPVVIDLTSLWAGPLCAHLLGLAGARVIKVESTTRPDGARKGPTGFFDLLHGGHESVALDFTTSRGRSALAALVSNADVVLDSSRPRALAQLGIVADDVVGNGTIWTAITAYGRCGPRANHVGYGDDVAAAAGLVVYDDGTPLPCGDAIADPLAGVHAAVATAAALRADRAHLIDVSMYDVVASTVTLDSRPDGENPVPAPPRARKPSGAAAALGRHTREVLDEFGIRA